MRVLVMWVCTAEVPSKPGPGAGAAADRFVILPRRVAEQEVVHRRLAQAMAPSAPNSALQVACDTSVLPATTAAPGSGDRNVPGGMTISIGFRQPSFSGISCRPGSGTRTAPTARVTAGGALKLSALLRPGAGEVDDGRARGVIDADAHAQRRAVVHRVGRTRRRRCRSMHAAHAFLGIVHDVAHVGARRRPSRIARRRGAVPARPSRWRRPAP